VFYFSAVARLLWKGYVCVALKFAEIPRFVNPLGSIWPKSEKRCCFCGTNATALFLELCLSNQRLAGLSANLVHDRTPEQPDAGNFNFDDIPSR
jgi:hypothetical protein